MSASFKCPGCEMGEHSRHVEHWDKAAEGVLGGAHCPCNGDCKAADFSALFPGLPVVPEVRQGVPFQADVLAWVRRRWPDLDAPLWRAAKLCEEAGEVIGAVIKYHEGRKTLADIEQETAQLVICAMGVAESVGFDLQQAVANEWKRCSP